MTYDDWKATNPADEWLGADPAEERRERLEDERREAWEAFMKAVSSAPEVLRRYLAWREAEAAETQATMGEVSHG